jgi:hypothetical protein
MKKCRSGHAMTGMTGPAQFIGRSPSTHKPAFSGPEAESAEGRAEDQSVPGRGKASASTRPSRTASRCTA